MSTAFIGKDIAHKALDDHYIVVGFFTPDYRPLAAAFARNLFAHSAPFHLYAVPGGAWDEIILEKPAIVERAMTDYPGRKIILMDVDCTLHGYLGNWAKDQTADVVLPARIRQGRRRHGRVLFSSRVILFAPTRPAAALAAAWGRRCAEADVPPFGRLCDERELVGAIGEAHGATLAFTEDAYAGLNARNAPPNAKITHESARAKTDTWTTDLGKVGQRAFDVLRGKRPRAL